MFVIFFLYLAPPANSPIILCIYIELSTVFANLYEPMRKFYVNFFIRVKTLATVATGVFYT